MTPIERTEVLQAIRELKLDLKEDLADQAKQLTQIREHVSKTNGRVVSLELWKARAEGIRAAYNWVIPVVASILGAVIGAGALVLLAGSAVH